MNALKADLIAGFSVFLLALPLCLGIALASQFPPSAGIITAILGGIITSFFGGAKLTIKGPAAGLIVIVSGCVLELGQGDLFLGYKRTLAVGVIAAVLQIIIALRKKAIIKDLLGLGVANLCSSLVGGLPMIAEIVRSKANLEYGAQSAKANFFHGIFMLIAAVALTPYINLIPLSALAALLILVGFKLASPKAFLHAYQIGIDQFFLFITTFVVTLVEDLLTGVIAGILLKLFFHFIRGNNIKNLFKPSVSLEHSEEATTINVSGPLTFVAYLKLKRFVGEASEKKTPVIIDLSKSNFVDHTIMTKLLTLKELSSDTLLVITGAGHLRPLYNHALSTRMFWG